MFRNSFSAAAAFVALSALPGFATVDKVAEVTVSADMAAIQNEKAAVYWATLTADLQGAILARLEGRVDEAGAKISVDISEVELASSFERAINAADAVLVGNVNVTDPTNNNNYDTYEITVSLGSSPMISADGTQIVFSTLDEPQAYETLISTFADGVMMKLNE